MYSYTKILQKAQSQPTIKTYFLSSLAFLQLLRIHGKCWDARMWSDLKTFSVEGLSPLSRPPPLATVFPLVFASVVSLRHFTPRVQEKVVEKWRLPTFKGLFSDLKRLELVVLPVMKH